MIDFLKTVTDIAIGDISKLIAFVSMVIFGYMGFISQKILKKGKMQC